MLDSRHILKIEVSLFFVQWMWSWEKVIGDLCLFAMSETATGGVFLLFICFIMGMGNKKLSFELTHWMPKWRLQVSNVLLFWEFKGDYWVRHINFESSSHRWYLKSWWPKMTLWVLKEDREFKRSCTKLWDVLILEIEESMRRVVFGVPLLEREGADLYPWRERS